MPKKTFSLEEGMGGSTPLVFADRTSKKTPDAFALGDEVKGTLPKNRELFNAIKDAAQEFGVPLEYGLALADQESDYNLDAHNESSGADGPFQYIPESAKARGMVPGVDTRDPVKAARAAMQDFAEQMEKGGVEWAIKHHFAGPNTREHGSNTRRYLAEVEKRAEDIKRLLAEGYLPGAPVESTASTKPAGPKTFSLEEGMGGNVLLAGQQQEQEPETSEASMLGSVRDFAVESGKHALSAADRIWEQIKNRALTDAGQIEFDDPRFTPVRGTSDPLAYTRALRKKKEAQQNEIPPVEGFINNLENPVKLLTEDSLPANFLEAAVGANEQAAVKLMEARKVAMQEEIVANPHKYPAVSVEAAKQAIAAREAKQSPEIKAMWNDLKQAAKEDPGRFGAQLVNALIADPELLFVPQGMGLRVLGTAEKATKGATVAQRAARIADTMIDAGVTGGGLNLGIEAASAASEGRELTSADAAFAGGIGFAVGAALGPIFMRGRAARTKLENGEVNADTVPNILSDMAKEDLAAETIINDPNPISAVVKHRIEEAAGVKFEADADLKAYLKNERRRWRKLFEERDLNGQFQKALAEERIARREQLMAEASERDAAQQAGEAKWDSVAGPVEEAPEVRTARFQQEYEAALEARQKAADADVETQAAAEDQLRNAARKLDEQEVFEAALTEDVPAVKRAMNSALRRDSKMRTPKWQRGEVDSQVLKELGITAAAATAGAAMYPDDPKMGALAGVLISGIAAAGRGSAGRRGGRARIKETGAIKPKGGNWEKGVVGELSPYAGYVASESADVTATAVKRYLNRYAGTVDDPLKDFILPDGTRWEDAMDKSIKKTGEDSYGGSVYGLDRGLGRALGKIRGYMDHVGDYLKTLPESEVAKMDFVRMVKETKRWDEANARKMEKASVKSMKDAEVLKEYPDGFKWIRLNKPGQFANESDLMGHSVRGYEPSKMLDDPHKYFTGEHFDRVNEGISNPEDFGGTVNPDWTPESVGGHPEYGFGGWNAIKQDHARVYSLRKPNGRPVATVEIANDANGWFVSQVKGPRNEPVKSDYAQKLGDFVETLDNQLGGLDTGPAKHDFKQIIPESQRGSADPRTLARLGVGGLFAAGAYALAPEDQKLQSAFAAGLAGLIIPGGGSVLRRMAQSGATTADGDIISLLVRQGKLKVGKSADEILAREAELLDRAKQGDQAAFKELYDENFPKVARYAKKQLGAVAERVGTTGDDVAQDVFLKAFTKLDQFSGDVPFQAYLITMARNEVKNVKRSAQAVKRGKDIAFKGLARETDEMLDDAPIDFDPEVEAAMADIGSPEEVAIRKETESILAPLIERLPPDEKRAFLLTRIEQFTLEDAAIIMGKPLSTVHKWASNAQNKIMQGVERNFEWKLANNKLVGETPEPQAPRLNKDGTPAKRRGRRPGSKALWNSQKGEVDPRLLRTGAVVGMGALAGAYLNDQNKLLGAGIGAGLAGILFARSHKGTTTHSQISNVADYTLGITSTRIMNKSKPLWRRAIEHERTVLRDIHANLQKVKPFLDKLKQLSPEANGALSRAILTGNPEVTNRLLTAIGDTELTAAWKEVRSTLDSLGDQLVHLRRFSKKELDYFPRVVKDVDGLLKALGKERGSFLEEVLKEADAKSIRARGTGLTELERSLVINRVLKDGAYKGQQPGFAKNRGVEEITPELQKFYAKPAESIHSYIRSAVEDIQRAKFFGKDLDVIKKGGKEYTNVDTSIGNIVQRLMKEGKLQAKDAEEVASLLRSRFINGERSPMELIQAAKNLSYAGLLGNPWSAITQLGDTIMQVYTQDLRSTLSAVVRNLTGRKLVSMKEFGLVDHIAEEFVNTSKTARFLNKIFAASLFKGIDAFGKDTALNAAVLRYGRLAKSEKGIREIARKWEDSLMPGELDQLIKDLQKGEVTDLVRSVAFAELSRTQPVTRLELPQAYLDNPNGRLLYQYKTFMLKQIDLARRDGYAEIKKGNIVKGLKQLIELSIVLGIAGTTTDKIRDFLLGRDIELEATDIPMNMLKTFGMSEYIINNMFGVSKEEAEARREAGEENARATKARPAETALGFFAPPAQMFDQIVTGDPRALRYIPLIGPYLLEQYKAEKQEEE